MYVCIYRRLQCGVSRLGHPCGRSHGRRFVVTDKNDSVGRNRIMMIGEMMRLIHLSSQVTRELSIRERGAVGGRSGQLLLSF